MIIVLILVGSGWSIWFILKSATTIHAKLNCLKEKAKLANTPAELHTVWEELKAVDKECWHRSFSVKVIEIKTIIETKYTLLS
jgi:hypothetical protein